MLGSRIRTALGAVTITVLAVALVAPVGANQGGNGNGHGKGHTRKAAMQTCKKGGWRNVEKEDGSRFKNQGRCVSYIVRGHDVSPIEASVSITFEQIVDTETCAATGVVEDLGASQSYLGDLLVDTVAQPQVSVTTDASGEGTVALGAYLTGQVLNLTVNGTTSGDVAVDCGIVPPPPPGDPI